MPASRRQRIALATIFGVLVPAVAVYMILFRGPSTPSEMAAYLPDKGGTLLYVDVDGMRKSGILNMLTGSKAAEEFEYKEFVDQTGFDYRHDLDAITATFRGGQVFFVLKGSFHWDRIHNYVTKRGGNCKGSYCAVDGSQPQRRISFHQVGSKIMAMAISTDDMAAYQITRNASKVSPFTPDAPLWVLVPSAVLKESNSLPAGMRSFAIALENAERVVFSAGPEGDHLEVALNVTCRNVESASALLVELENTTNMLRKLIAREHQTPNPADFSGVLTSGTFRAMTAACMASGLFSACLSTRSREALIKRAGVLCCGSIVADVLVRPVEEPGWGKTTWVEDIEVGLGGNGANTSYTLAKLGIPVRLLSALGEDAFGRQVVTKLESAGVDVSRIEWSTSAPTPTSVVLVHPDGTRALLHRPGVNREVFPNGIALTDGLANGASHLHMANIFALRLFQERASDLLRQARERGMRTSMDTGWDPCERWMQTIGPCLPFTDLLFVNEDEARQLTGSSEPACAVSILRDHGARDIVVKIGSQGCYVKSDLEEFCVPGFRVEAVDTTGAGDCFAGGFIAALHNGLTYREAARFANAVGALNVQSLGAVTGVRGFEETLAWASGEAGYGAT